jgi:serine/threonine-protein kinase RsbW
VAETARIGGFNRGQAARIAKGVRAGLRSLFVYSFEPGEQTDVELSSELIPSGLRVSIRDRGLPFETGGRSGAAGRAGPPFGLQAYFDEVLLRNRGREGKEIVLIAHFPDPSLAEYAASCGIGAAPATVPDRDGGAAESRCTVRPLNAAEAPEVSKAVYRAYGYTYPHDYVYYPEKLVELNRNGRIFSVVAATAENEIAGHCSLRLWEDNPRIAELSQGVVSPRYRSQGCFAAMTDYLIRAARRKKLDGVFGEAVMNHPFSQKTSLQFGLRDCGLLAGTVPASAEFKGLGGSAFGPGCMLIQFNYLQRPRSAPVVAPPAHRDIIAAIYANLGRRPRIRPPEAAPSLSTKGSRLNVKLIRALGTARIRVDSWGMDAPEVIRRQLKALCLQKWEIVQLLLSLADPFGAHFCERLEQLGFFFAGILPCGLPGGDVLILQYLNNITVRYDTLKTASDFAPRLVAYVRERDPNQMAS